jgi:hypothetical protein
MEFCAYASSRDESILRVVHNASIAADGSDPFRTSHLNIVEWLDQGYEEASTSEYFANIQESLTSLNCVTDERFPSGSEIYAVLDKGTNCLRRKSNRAYMLWSNNGIVRRGRVS